MKKVMPDEFAHLLGMLKHFATAGEGSMDSPFMPLLNHIVLSQQPAFSFPFCFNATLMKRFMQKPFVKDNQHACNLCTEHVGSMIS